jgi:hypothetical protein
VDARVHFGHIRKNCSFDAMRRSTDRILTTHTGSIPRPPELLALASSKTDPPKDLGSYVKRLRSAVADVVRQQATVGICEVVGRAGIEPATNGLKVQCSTN